VQSQERRKHGKSSFKLDRIFLLSSFRAKITVQLSWRRGSRRKGAFQMAEHVMNGTISVRKKRKKSSRTSIATSIRDAAHTTSTYASVPSSPIPNTYIVPDGIPLKHGLVVLFAFLPLLLYLAIDNPESSWHNYFEGGAYTLH